jgi:TolB-like protein
MKKTALTALSCLALFGLSACETTAPPPPTYEQAQASAFIKANYAAADVLASSIDKTGNKPLLVSTLADVSKLEESSPLGRMISEQVASRFVQKGLPVVEMKLRDNVFVKNNEGEFVLTRRIRELATSYDANTAMVGTYTDAGDYVFVSLKLVDVATSQILASHDYALPMQPEIRRMLRRGK